MHMTDPHGHRRERERGAFRRSATRFPGWEPGDSVLKVVLFGSHADGKVREDADLDLLLVVDLLGDGAR